ncbi:prepilin peptidase [Pseudomonas purpurea]|uniref:prepilin peptidase n=1 Tax=Pseudomonas purpurea TaxID=3136737 RepID=UPI003267C8D4
MHSLVLLIWLALCAAQDAQQRHIANALTLGGAALALVYLLWAGSTWLGASAAQGGWAFLLALAFTVPGYALGRLGAADVKLMATIGLASDTLTVLGCFVGAGVASLVWLVIGPKLWPSMSQGLRHRLRYLAPELSKNTPFAPFVWIGLLASLLWIH